MYNKRIATLKNMVSELEGHGARAKLGVSKAEAKAVIIYLLTVRYLERIADHASYVAESATYAETGKRIVLR